MNPDEYIVVGRMVAPHGVRGDLRILPDTERPQIFKALKNLRIGAGSYKVLSSRPHKNIYILHVEGIEDRNAAERLIGEEVSIPVRELPELPKGEYYYFQLIGLAVISDTGEPVGNLKEIIETGANNVYSVQASDGKEILLPAISSCILSVDTEKGEMTVHLPEWE